MHLMAKSMAAMSLLCSATVHAEGGYYIGGVAGQLTPDDTDRVTVEDYSFNAGIRGGYTWISGFGVEAEYTTSVVDGLLEVNNGFDKFTLGYAISTLGLYGTYRSPGDIYFKAKLGYLREDVTVGFRSNNSSDTNVSFGLGAGFNFTKSINLEAEYTQLEGELDFWSGSLVYRF